MCVCVGGGGSSGGLTVVHTYQPGGWRSLDKEAKFPDFDHFPWVSYF